MEAQVELIVPNDAAQLRDQVAILEAEIAREQAMRRNAEAERDEARRELALIKEAANQDNAPACQLVNVKHEHAADAQTETHREPTHSAPPVTGPQSHQHAAPDTMIDPADAGEKRQDPRVASRLSATYWRAGMVEAANCTICDKSSGGARLEFAPDPYRNRVKELAVGDQLTLSFDTALERTSVVCIVMWAVGNRCGVRFSGQFHNTLKSTRTAPRMRPVPKAASGNMLTRWRSGAR